jgi:hypothetical protein
MRGVLERFASSEAIPVEVRSVHHDWLDVLAAFAGVAGVIGAGVAMVAVARSAAQG